MNRLFLGRFFRLISKSWHMYPLGMLFGLGFDTATEVGLLAIAAGVATHQMPFLAILSLPILFAAGMSLMDTADGAFMSQAYGWAFSNPVRKVYYNITVTSLSVTVALVGGRVAVAAARSTRPASGPERARLRTLGYAIVGLFVVTWAGPSRSGRGDGSKSAGAHSLTTDGQSRRGASRRAAQESTAPG